VHKLLNDPDFKNKVTNYFDLVKNNLLDEYKQKIVQKKGKGAEYATKPPGHHGHNSKPARKNMTVVTK